MPELHGFGTVARLQVHADHVLSAGRYDPSRLLVTDRVAVTTRGVTGFSDGSWVLDVHHRDHPARAQVRPRSVSIGFTSAYARMRDRFGERAALGAAAENTIVATDRQIAIDDLQNGVVIRAKDGRRLRLDDAMIANPCREFASYLLGPDHPAGDGEIGDDLRFLRGGTRGFILSLAEGEDLSEIAVGDPVYLPA